MKGPVQAEFLVSWFTIAPTISEWMFEINVSVNDI